MIRRVFKGSSAYGLIKYLYGEGRRNEHTDVHLIASWDEHPAGLEPQWIPELDRHNVAPLVRLLEQPVKACDRPPAQWVYHLVFRNDDTDRRLSDEEWADVARTAMDRTNIAPADDPAGCRWVAVRHADDHIHLVATLAREDGRPPRVFNDYYQLAAVAHEFEATYGLRTTAGRDDNTAAARPGVKEQVTAERAGRRESPRITLRHKVKTAAASSHGFAEFTDRLRADGVTVWPRMSERNPDQITGYSVSLDDWTNAAGQPVRFGGGKLAPDLSWPKLRARWAPDTTTPTDPDRGRHHTPEPDQPRETAKGGPLSGPDADYVWREAERIVRSAADRISAEAGTDPDAAADAAWAASDTLAAAANAVEGDTGGPLTDAADAFDRAGRQTYKRIPTRTDTGTALRSAGRMVALLAPGTQHPAAQTAALTVALAGLVAAVGDLRTAQQRLHQAEAARASAEHLRRVAPVPFATPAAAPDRKMTAADIARLSTGSGPFFIRTPNPTARAGTDDPARTRTQNPNQGRTHGPRSGR